MLRCAFCGTEMIYVHGHAACGRGECPMRGVNQAECCSGEQGCVPTSAIARAPQPDRRDEPRDR
ncbi:hypothetical protein [Sandaracinus amylolyticus]|uniref:hypothetical protein n=1 Tax=Sandaracinus amylolyticus TaxID=927083 RepID=UPI001F34FDB7|nr:hypothetical protein [Sandaracinus amylolyticus]UJR84596.1 Hypothetical protein I5071_66750 [Sandaracinus amylolyticus]